MRHKQVNVYEQVQNNQVWQQGKLLTSFCPLDRFIGSITTTQLKPAFDVPTMSTVETFE